VCSHWEQVQQVTSSYGPTTFFFILDHSSIAPLVRSSYDGDVQKNPLPSYYSNGIYNTTAISGCRNVSNNLDKKERLKLAKA